MKENLICFILLKYFVLLDFEKILQKFYRIFNFENVTGKTICNLFICFFLRRLFQ